MDETQVIIPMSEGSQHYAESTDGKFLYMYEKSCSSTMLTYEIVKKNDCSCCNILSYEVIFKEAQDIWSSQIPWGCFIVGEPLVSVE